MSHRPAILAGRLAGAYFLLVLAVFGSVVVAQNSRGGINGNVADSSGAVVPGSEVKAVAAATSAEYDTNTSSAGEFLFPDLPVGEYKVLVSNHGFQTAQFNRVPVTAGTIYTLQVKLSPTEVQTTVEVNADQ